MILTEEQRAAIKLAMKYIARWPFAYKELHARGVLQAMIDSSEHIREPPKMVGFDLEKARAADEVLPYPLDAKEIWVSGKGQMHINPPNAPSIFFTLSDLCEFRNIFHGQAAEIERLRASLIDLHAEYINTLEKNPECSAWDLDEQSDADQKRLRRNAAHAISIVEPPIYLQAEQRATKIKELEDALVEERVIGEGGFRAGQCEFWYIEDLPEESCMELDGLCDWAKCPRKHELCDVAYQQLAEEGKIGPDARPKCDHAWQAAIEERGYQTCLKCGECRNIEDIPRTAPAWQITEERKAAIRDAEIALRDAVLDSNDPHCWDAETAVLRGMLEEADHDKP